jgi:hypothetical protein
MYDLVDYRDMTADRVRADAYAAALRGVVRRDDVVLDVGAGVGILSVLAARAGARLVYAVESNPCVQHARSVLEANGVLDRVVLLRGRVEDVSLPEAPTLLVADLRGPLPLDSKALSAWRAALPRLAPGGRTVPRRDVLYAQPVRSETLADGVHRFGPVAGVSFDPLRAPLANERQPEPSDATPLAPERPLYEVRYALPFPRRFEGAAEFSVEPPAVVHGFRVGFEADLAPGVSFRSFGPGRAPAYGVHVLPAPSPLDVRAPTRLRLRVACDVLGDAAPLRWAVDVDGREGAWQGSFLHAPESLDVLRAGQPDHVPAPDPDDDLDAVLLGAFARGRALRDAIAEAAAALGDDVPAGRVEARAVELSRRRQARVVRRLGGA